MTSAPVSNLNSRILARRILPWILSLIVVIALAALMVTMKLGHVGEKDDLVTVRNVDVTLPPPPEPPPPLKTRQAETESATPSIDLIGAGSGPSMNYSDNPKLTVLNLEKVDQPQFDTQSLDLRKTLALDFPVLEVKELDKIPRLVSTNRVSFPKEMRDRGINRIATKVEIIIDQNGQAFVKKIVDPVYPEMIDVIRKAINDSRFTVPTKDGRPVQAIYLYTLVFINKV
jgi:protein TonB